MSPVEYSKQPDGWFWSCACNDCKLKPFGSKSQGPFDTKSQAVRNHEVMSVPDEEYQKLMVAAGFMMRAERDFPEDRLMQFDFKEAQTYIMGLNRHGIRMLRRIAKSIRNDGIEPVH